MIEPSSPSESATGAVLHLYSDGPLGTPLGSSLAHATARAAGLTKSATRETAVATSARTLADVARNNLSGETLHQNNPIAAGRSSISAMEQWPIPSPTKSNSTNIDRDAAAERGRYDAPHKKLHRSATQETLAPQRSLRGRAARLWGNVRAKFENRASRKGRTEREVADLREQVQIKRQLSQKWGLEKELEARQVREPKTGKRDALLIAAAPEIYKPVKPGTRQINERPVGSSERAMEEDIRAFLMEAYGYVGKNLDHALSMQRKEMHGEISGEPEKKDVKRADREDLANQVRSRDMVHGLA